MTDQNTNQQLRYIKETALCLQRAGFHTEPVLGSVLPVTLEGQSLGCVTSKGSVLIHRDNIGNEEAENAAHRMAVTAVPEFVSSVHISIRSVFKNEEVSLYAVTQEYQECQFSFYC